MVHLRHSTIQTRFIGGCLLNSNEKRKTTNRMMNADILVGDILDVPMRSVLVPGWMVTMHFAAAECSRAHWLARCIRPISSVDLTAATALILKINLM